MRTNLSVIEVEAILNNPQSTLSQLETVRQWQRNVCCDERMNCGACGRHFGLNHYLDLDCVWAKAFRFFRGI